MGSSARTIFGSLIERARDAHPLLLAAGELRWQVVRAVFQSHAFQGVKRFLLVGHAVEVLRQHDVFERGEVGNQVKLLEDEADLFRPDAIQLLAEMLATFSPSSQISPDDGTIQAADQD